MNTMAANHKVAVVRTEGGLNIETYSDDLQLLRAQMYRFCARNGGDTKGLDEVWKNLKKEIKGDFK